MKSFTPETVSSESFSFVSGIIKKHGLGLRVKDGKIPEEFTSVTKWFLNAYIWVSKTLQFDELSQNLAGLNIKHNKAYLEMKEIKETIKDSDDKIYKLLEAIDICEKNIKRSKNYSNCESFELDSLKAELFNCEGVLKKCRGQKELVIEDTPVSMLIDSLFVSQCYSPDPKVIEFKKYSEDSIVELPTQRNLPVSNNTFENTYSETIETKKQIIKTSKKKCCGLILNCKNP